MDDDDLKMGRLLVLILGILVLIFEYIELALTNEQHFIRCLLDIALFVAVFCGYNWARILSVVLFGLGGTLGLGAIIGMYLMIPVISGPSYTSAVMPDALIAYSVAYAIYCIAAALVLGISKSVKSLSAQRKTKL